MNKRKFFRKETRFLAPGEAVDAGEGPTARGPPVSLLHAESEDRVEERDRTCRARPSVGRSRKESRGKGQRAAHARARARAQRERETQREGRLTAAGQHVDESARRAGVAQETATDGLVHLAEDGRLGEGADVGELGLRDAEDRGREGESESCSFGRHHLLRRSCGLLFLSWLRLRKGGAPSCSDLTIAAPCPRGGFPSKPYLLLRALRGARPQLF